MEASELGCPCVTHALRKAACVKSPTPQLMARAMGLRVNINININIRATAKPISLAPEIMVAARSSGRLAQMPPQAKRLRLIENSFEIAQIVEN